MAHTRDVFDAMLTGRPYPVKAAISVASNPIMSLPDSFRFPSTGRCGKLQEAMRLTMKTFRLQKVKNFLPSL